MHERKPSNWMTGAGLLLAALLSACGGGGATRPDPPPAAPPPTPPPPPPPDPPPTVVQPPNPAYSNHLSWTGAGSAHEAGLSGDGIRIGVVDSGVNRNHPALAGQVVANLTYINPNTNDLSVDDFLGHGTAVAQIIAGQRFGQWPGGIAPGAEIVSARIISDEPPEDDGSGEGNEVDGALGLAPIHQHLIDRDVRIMNNSWGGLYWTNPAATAPIAAEYRPFIVDHGGLVVFSAGNAGFDDPSDMSALPSQPGTGGTRPAADLERGWLAVAALSESDPTRLADYSNACGVAMHYCLAAPGTVIVTGTDDAPDEPEYWRWRGTSFAAPIVSGAAALVWEAFPYFDNDLVRQTLLGTATDIGEAGVDPVFGYGRLDIGRAVLGPSRLDWGDLVADFDGISSNWGNALAGEGALVKRGSGTLVLNGSAGNAGGIRVEEGGLHSYFYVHGDVTVSRNASYGIGIAVDGDLHNGGEVVLLGREGSGAGLAMSDVGGHYSQTADAVLALDIGQSLGALTASIDGGTLHVRGIRDGYTSSDREPVLSTTLGLEGRFDTMTWTDSLFLEAMLRYDEFAAWLDIARLDVAAAAKAFRGVGASSLSAAQRLENAFDQLDRAVAGGHAAPGDAFLRVAGDFQAIGDEATAIAALDSLSGESHSLATTLTFDAVDMGRRALSSRLGELQPGTEYAGAWTRSLGQGGGVGLAGGGFQPDGWLMGRDQSLGNGLVAGFAFGETRADDRVGGNRDRSRDRQTQASLYLGRLSADGYVATHAGFGRFDRDIERWLFAGADARAGVFGAYSGGYASVGAEAGRHLRLGAWRLTPYLGADHVRVQNDGFAEWGSGFALQARAATLRRTQATAGVRGAFDWRGARLHAYSEWQQTLSAAGFEVDASFVDIDSWSPLPLADAAKSGGLFGVGLDAPLGRGASVSLGLDQRFGPRGDERTGSLRYAIGF
ncbi:autotransporter serine protease [Luteimonas saliphila]|uniref:autotransporter serine protease n=1 Tax=Luteimonas saliphila TaxID=2804919 RepID=UPI001EE18718|nr:autotransporter serine protease [Luteimonas saliphila]